MSRQRRPNRHREKQAPRSVINTVYLRARIALAAAANTNLRVAPLFDALRIVQNPGWGNTTPQRMDWDRLGVFGWSHV